MATEIIEEHDARKELLNNFEWEMNRIQYDMSLYDVSSEEWQHLDQNLKDIYAKYIEAYKLYYPEEFRENISSSYAEETIRKEDLMGISQKELITQLEENIAECNALMTRWPTGSDEYMKLAELKTSYTKQYLDALKAADERNKDVWDKIKWVGTILKDLAIALIPLAVYVTLFHQSLDFESEGSYRSRTTSNLVSKMTPKGLQG